MNTPRKSLRHYEQPFSSEALPEQRFLIQNKGTHSTLAMDENEGLVVIPDILAEDSKIHKGWAIYPINYGPEVMLAQYSPKYPKLYDSLQYVLPSEVFINGAEFNYGRQTWYIATHFVPQREPKYSIRTASDPSICLSVEVSVEGVLTPVIVRMISYIYNWEWAITPVGT